MRSPILILATALLLATGSSASAAPVGYWRFDNDGKIAGQTLGEVAGEVIDETGTNHGAATGDPPFAAYSADVFGTPLPQTGAANGLSMDFEEDFNQVIVVPYHSSLTFGASAFTIEAWVRMETLADSPTSGGRAYVVQKKGSAGKDFLQDYTFMAQSADRWAKRVPGVGKQTGFTGRELGYGFGDGNSGGEWFVISNLEINDTNWHFISMAFDGSDTVRFGLDGVFETITGLSVVGHHTNLGALTIGSRATGPESTRDFFDGKIDELRISSGVVPEAELLDAVSIPANPFPPDLSIEVDGVHLDFTADNGLTYQAESTSTLLPGSWIPVGAPVVGTGAPATVIDPAGLGHLRYYYRLFVTLTP